ncbi:MAG: CBS domain-containing protein [Anaerolineae bacterium]|jgi:CBS domain-containing protein|nr:CBS domain-containing protein [Anaerolineae bacterium]
MLNNFTVKEWMTSPVITVTPDTTLSAAHQLMKDKNVRRLMVVENEKLVGVITKGDVREASPSDATSLSIWELNYLWAQLTVEKVMTRQILKVNSHDPISKVARLMLENKVSGLPVMDENDRLVGVITESDIFRMLVITSEQVSQS